VLEVVHLRLSQSHLCNVVACVQFEVLPISLPFFFFFLAFILWISNKIKRKDNMNGQNRV
jgi:hypothetical protein